MSFQEVDWEPQPNRAIEVSIDEKDSRPGVLCTKSFQTLENLLGYGKLPELIYIINTAEAY